MRALILEFRTCARHPTNEPVFTYVTCLFVCSSDKVAFDGSLDMHRHKTMARRLLQDTYTIKKLCYIYSRRLIQDKMSAWSGA